MAGEIWCLIPSPGFSYLGSWVQSPDCGYAPSSIGDGAVWSWSGLAPGLYSIRTAWPAGGDHCPDAKFLATGDDPGSPLSELVDQRADSGGTATSYECGFGLMTYAEICQLGARNGSIRLAVSRGGSSSGTMIAAPSCVLKVGDLPAAGSGGPLRLLPVRPPVRAVRRPFRGR